VEKDNGASERLPELQEVKPKAEMSLEPDGSIATAGKPA
jgi:hypothetical protein